MRLTLFYTVATRRLFGLQCCNHINCTNITELVFAMFVLILLQLYCLRFAIFDICSASILAFCNICMCLLICISHVCSQIQNCLMCIACILALCHIYVLACLYVFMPCYASKCSFYCILYAMCIWFMNQSSCVVSTNLLVQGV